MMKTKLASILFLGVMACGLRATEPFFVDLAPVVNTSLENNGQDGWRHISAFYGGMLSPMSGVFKNARLPACHEIPLLFRF